MKEQAGKDSLTYALKYEHITKRRGKKRTNITISRMILTAICSMLSSSEVWNPVNFYKIDMPEHLKGQQLAKAVKQRLRLLEKQCLIFHTVYPRFNWMQFINARLLSTALTVGRPRSERESIAVHISRKERVLLSLTCSSAASKASG